MSSVVVADAGPLHYLILVDCAETLPKLFDRVLIPSAVREELSHHNTPAKVADWMRVSKPWLTTESVIRGQPIAGLHKGEEEAIHLALQTKIPNILMDDTDGRLAARRRGLTVFGTIGILERAAELGLIDLAQAVGKLRQTNFFVSPELLNAALERDIERRKRQRE